MAQQRQEGSNLNRFPSQKRVFSVLLPCELCQAKTGCLDARGLGAIDPWRTALVAMATPKQKLVELKSEQDWLDEKGHIFG